LEQGAEDQQRPEQPGHGERVVQVGAIQQGYEHLGRHLDQSAGTHGCQRRPLHPAGAGEDSARDDEDRDQDAG
jgi:hypothetical protein